MDRLVQRFLVVTVVATVAMIYIYPLALPTPLLDPDEGLHATIAQEMVERGDYLIPRYCGKPFRDKPILYFVAEAASLRAFGMNEAAVRLPGAMFSLLGCFTTALLAARLFNKEVAAYSLLASLTLVFPMMLTISPAHDIALVPAVNCLVLCFWEQQRATDDKAARKWLVGGAACVALALLAKGLIGIGVISAGLGLYIVFTRSLSWRLVSRCALTLALGGLLASPWFFAMEAASPGYLKYYFVQRHLLGFVTEGQEHGDAPWYYYVAPVLGGGMPWLVFAAAASAQLARDDRQSKGSRAVLLLTCWFLGGFVFLTIAGSKLVTYSLPLFPPVAILAGVAFNRLFHGTLAPGIRWGVVNSFRCACVFGILAPVITLMILGHFLGSPSPVSAYAAAVAASLLMLTALVMFESDRARLALMFGVLWFPMIFVTVVTWPFQPVAEQHSQRSLAREISSSNERPQQIVLVGERAGSVLFYLSQADRDWFREGRIREHYLSDHESLPAFPSNTWVAVTDKTLRRSVRAQELAGQGYTSLGRFCLIKSPKTSVAAGSHDEPSRK